MACMTGYHKTIARVPRVRRACLRPARSGGGVLREVLVDPLDLARLVDARPRQADVVPRELHAIERLEGGRLAREQITHTIAELLGQTLLEEGYAQALFKFIH